MPKKLSYFMELLGGGLMIALIYVWSQPDRKQDVSRVSEWTPHEVFQDGSNAQFQSLQRRFEAEQATLREQLAGLQEVLASHIEKTETAGTEVSLPVDAGALEIAESYRAPITKQELGARIAYEDFTQQEAIAAQLDAEEVDPGWSDLAETEIRAAFETDENLNARVTGVKCRSISCRVEGAFGDADARDQFISALMTLVPWETQAFYHADEQEGAAGALYILKPGVSELPSRP